MQILEIIMLRVSCSNYLAREANYPFVLFFTNSKRRVISIQPVYNGIFIYFQHLQVNVIVTFLC